MKPEAIREILAGAGALLEGHFLLTSGRHSPFFVQCSQVLQHPERVARLAGELVVRLALAPPPDAVAGPAMGGIILAYETARILGARAVYAEKGPEGMVFRRGFRLRPGERVLVVEDVVTTGGSVQAVIDAVDRAGARVLAVGALVDRSGGRVRFPAPFAAALSLPAEDYSPDDCPLCREGVPLTRPKH
ncbi:MAG: orotate phosphoribosyltransferase [bacterium]|nr:orotate phosphoribosyltransferase [bacterium]